MDYSISRRCTKWFAAASLLGGSIFLASCDQFAGPGNREAQFLTRRVEALEKKVGELEGEIARLRAGGPAPIEGIGGIGGIGESGLSGGERGVGAVSAIESPEANTDAGSGGGSGAVAISNRAAESLASDVDRANILMLKAKQLQVVSRAELPQLISNLQIVAPEVDELQAQIRTLEAERLRLSKQGGTGSPEATAVEAELEKLRFRLELVCEGVRQRVLDDSRAASARLQETTEGGADSDQKPIESLAR